MTEPKVLIKANFMPVFYHLYRIFRFFFLESTNCERVTELSQMEGLSFALTVPLGTLPYSMKIFRPRKIISLEQTVYFLEYSAYSKTFWKSRLPFKKNTSSRRKLHKMFAVQFSSREAGHYDDATHFLCFFFTKYIHEYYSCYQQCLTRLL